MKPIKIHTPYRPRVNPYRKHISAALCGLAAVILTVFLWPDVWTRICGLMLVPLAAGLGWCRVWEYKED
ncbi:hypothetical protein [Scatolibacter rhodanostii]|uniref:hypothetical protein n=1 Tax=Scatolibacter rhodanostii TaxID=2014781 RepID=UPI000C06BA39|nr:hypothetical protein [Scatolibacter rhodanostii]